MDRNRRRGARFTYGTVHRKSRMAFRFSPICVAILLCAAACSRALAQGYPGYPDVIMNPPPRVAPYHPLATGHQRGADEATRTRNHHSGLLGRETFIGKLHRRGLYAARGSSGSVLPTPLPKTQLIPPEGNAVLTQQPFQQEQGPTQIPGTAKIIPNLPHGNETFQDRASRCTFQAGLYNVPGNLRNRYMGACVQ